MRLAQRSPAGVHDGSAKHVRVPEAGARRRRGEARHDEVSTGDLRQRREKRGKRREWRLPLGAFAQRRAARATPRGTPTRERTASAKPHDTLPLRFVDLVYSAFAARLVKPSQWRVAPMSFERATSCRCSRSTAATSSLRSSRACAAGPVPRAAYSASRLVGTALILSSRWLRLSNDIGATRH